MELKGHKAVFLIETWQKLFPQGHIESIQGKKCQKTVPNLELVYESMQRGLQRANWTIQNELPLQQSFPPPDFKFF